MVTCMGYGRSGPCGISRGLVDGYCYHHINQCRGYKVDGDKCRGPAKDQYDYCCATHDSNKVYANPRPFRPQYGNLRAEKESDIVNLYKGQDPYHDAPLLRLDRCQLDHKVEAQMFAYAVLRATRRDEKARKEATVFVRDEIANKNENLCLTRTTTNTTKGRACFQFVDDSRTGHRGDREFTDYLLAQRGQGEKLTRSECTAIRKEMGKALKFSRRKLDDEDETPVFAKLSRQLQKMYVGMELKVTST